MPAKKKKKKGDEKPAETQLKRIGLIQAWTEKEGYVNLCQMAPYKTDYQRSLNKTDVLHKVEGFLKTGAWNESLSAIIIPVAKADRLIWAEEARLHAVGELEEKDCTRYMPEYSGVVSLPGRLTDTLGPEFSIVNGAHRIASLFHLTDSKTAKAQFTTDMKIKTITLKATTPADVLRALVTFTNENLIQARPNTALDDLETLLQIKREIRLQKEKDAAFLKKAAKNPDAWKPLIVAALQKGGHMESLEVRTARLAAKQDVSKLNKTFGYTKVFNSTWFVFKLLGGGSVHSDEEEMAIRKLISLQQQDHAANFRDLTMEIKEDCVAMDCINSLGQETVEEVANLWPTAGGFYPFPSDSCGLTKEHFLVDADITPKELV
jgi:hypothetical protein